MRQTYAVAMLSLVALVATSAEAAPEAPRGGCAGLQSELEPNNAPASASPIELSSLNRFSAIHGAIAVPGDEDWYSFPAPAGAQPRLWLSIDTGVAGPAGSRDSVVSIFAPTA